MGQATTGGTNAYILLVDCDPQNLVFMVRRSRRKQGSCIARPRTTE
jgi:hypothetical protein